MNCLCIWLQGPQSDARVIYIDGAFDLFHAGHVEVMNEFVHMQLIFFSF